MHERRTLLTSHTSLSFKFGQMADSSNSGTGICNVLHRMVDGTRK
jgi:hypothetical protein